MITPEMKALIERNTIGLVATVTPDGKPAVAPKGTTIVLDDTTVIFGDLRSPGTVRNIQRNPAVELNYVDVFVRKACRLSGSAAYSARGEARFDELLPHFAKWEAFIPRLRGIFIVAVQTAQFLRSPVYDIGADEADLRRQWLEHYSK